MFAKLFLLFLLLPLAELFLLIKIGAQIGFLTTVACVILTALLGAALARRQGFQVLQEFQTQLNQGSIPGLAIAEGVLILLAGAVLMTPGFITDTMGFLLLAPPIRKKLSSSILDMVQKRGGLGFRVWPKPGSRPGKTRPNGNEVNSTWRVESEE